MKIFSVSQIRAADQFTIENEPISSIDLMERAARSCYNWFHANISRQKSIGIFCGQGNNGGDGLALARMLKAGGFQVKVFIAKHAKNLSPDNLINLKRLGQWRIIPIEIDAISSIEEQKCDVWVDAILGSGLKSSLKGFLLELVDWLNQQEGVKVAIDVPTGLFADDNSTNNGYAIFYANHTLSFQFPKRSFLFPKFGKSVGEFHVLDIGLSSEYISDTKTTEYFVDSDFLKSLLLRRDKFDHKGTFGHALIIAGSQGKIGAAILATKAALRSGAGLVSAYLPHCGLNSMQAANPEVMVALDGGEAAIENIQFELKATAVGLGPGIGTSKKTAKAVIQFVASCKTPLVIDADGLNILSAYGDWSIVPKQSILTPHLGELDRILGKQYRGEDIFEPAREFAVKNEINLLVKGAHSAVYAADGNTYFNSTGSSAMATAGSGDVLTGIITGLLAQGFSPLNAAITAMYHHGLAGETASLYRGEIAVIASDIIEFLDIS